MTTLVRGRTDLDLDHLIQPDRVHRRVYVDPEIFELELERIFYRTWIYVGHESEVAHAGDYKTTLIGRQPVILSRHEDGNVHVLFNRCPHRGVLLCREERGNSAFFRCMYHGWTFRCNGQLLGVPFRSGYPHDFELDSLGMASAPAVASYRGFVFAKLSAGGVGLEEFLGPAKATIDNIVDRSPSGEVVVLPIAHKYDYRGNWKFQLENMNDIYHAPFSHESNQGLRRRIGAAGLTMTQTVNRAEETRVHATRYGHTYQSGVEAIQEDNRSGPVFEEYLAALEQRLGPEGAKAVLGRRFGNAAIYPTLILQEGQQHVRVIRPRAVDRTEVFVQPILYKGAPAEYNLAVIRYLNLIHSAASFQQTDDMEAFAREHEGLQAQQPEWLIFARGLHREVDGPDPGERIGHGTDETPIRGRYRFWKQLMSQEN